MKEFSRQDAIQCIQTRLSFRNSPCRDNILNYLHSLPPTARFFCRSLSVREYPLDLVKQVIGLDGYYLKHLTIMHHLDFVWFDQDKFCIEIWGDRRSIFDSIHSLHHNISHHCRKNSFTRVQQPTHMTRPWNNGLYHKRGRESGTIHASFKRCRR